MKSRIRFGAVLPLALLATACAMEPGEDLGEEQEALGITGPAFYVDGELYRTVGTPTELPLTAPEHSFDIIYNVSAYQMFNVAEAAPGQPGFNGGRWKVHAVSFSEYDTALALHDTNESGDFDSNEEIEAALDAGDAMDLGVVKVFVCPVNKLPNGP